MSGLVINWFPAEIAPTVLLLPYVDCASWDDSKRERNRSYREYASYRTMIPSGAVRIVLLRGPALASPQEQAEFDVGMMPQLGVRLIELALIDHLQKRGMRITSNSFGVIALREHPDFSQAGINLHSGVSFKARRPFLDEPHQFALSAQWEARAIFTHSLAHDAIKGMCKGMPVLYRPKDHPPEALQAYENRYLGRVRDLDGHDRAVVACRDGSSHNLSLGELYLEASPSSIRAYEKATGIEAEASVWRRIQELSLVARKGGGRNTSVLRDRLGHIISLLGGDKHEQLTIPAPSFAPAAVTIRLSPIAVGGDGV